MPRCFHKACWILLIGAALLASAGCGGGGDGAEPPLPDTPREPTVEGPGETETAPELPAPGTAGGPAMPLAEGPEEAEAAPQPAVPASDEPAALMEAPEVMDDVPAPAVSSPLLDPPPAPVVAYEGRLHVGAGVAPDTGQLAAIGMHDTAAVSYGWLQDGVGAGEVIAYLREHADVGEFKPDAGLLTFPTPPTVRLAEGTTDAMADLVMQAVRLLNANLPHDRRIRSVSERVTPLQPLDDIPDGEIFLDFAPWEDWTDPSKPPRESVVALAQWAWRTVVDAATGERLEIGLRAGRVWVDRDAILTAWVRDTTFGEWEETVLSRRIDDHENLEKWYSDQAVMAVVIHELLHTLGMGDHLGPDRFPYSIMTDERTDYDGVTGHILFPVDREALLAAYSVLEPGVLPEELARELGGWDDVSLHLRGEIDAPHGGAFGVAVRNGLAQPWAEGRMPDTILADSQRLSGTVSWTGRLLGFTPALQAVGGAADLSVELQTLAGQLDFSGLEHWPANAAPGRVGSGAQWGDGDLQYLLTLRGNTFEHTGGDAGAVTGAFFGQHHEAMGGVLERHDLTAAFGGTR